MSKDPVKSTALVIGAFIAAVLAVLFLFDYIYNRSNARLAIRIQSVNIGMLYSDAEKILGKPSRTFTDSKDVKDWGKIKNLDIIAQCNLYFFPDYGIPHRYILVYEDKETHTVRYVGWKGM